ncbi:MAG: vanadium-dependent haloperoxidase, partial [Planctomycetota bacterium]
GHTSMMSPLLDQTLAATPDGLGKTDGLALGQLIGNSILANRANDGWDTSVQYTHTNEPGHWQPDPVNPGQEAWGPAWGSVATFALLSPDSFAPPAMPDLTSQAYADAFNEVKSLGSVDSTTRTDEQTEIGLFWAYDREGMGTPMRLYNQALSTIAIQEGNTLEENAELFAKAAVATADAGVVAWQSKFEHDFWRPVTGIREADTDGNPLTIADPDWTPLGAPDDDGGVGFTPPFPTYLSGHATFGGAIFGALQEFYGTDDISFLLASEELGGLERSFDSFSEAMAENGRSRVYLGIHWNFDDTEAQLVGDNIAAAVFASPFVAIPEPTFGIAMFCAAGLLVRRRRN